ncbi:MAG TPA: DUF2867 domain-containing protein [Anaerolineales bacterium]|nr:DUF2867 domain-containing protein [Anaerolineales bacterium]
MPSPLILVTGATGYIASLLIPQLLEKGYRVRVMARQPERLRSRKWYSKVELCSGDITEPSTLHPALQGVQTAYYLIHNMSSGRGYTDIELKGAGNFASAAEKAGIEHIIYLGGLADPEQHIAPHMRSRIETGKVLRQGKVPVTEFRAGVIVGSGSISFEMIRFMTELFPAIPSPGWIKNRSQPIAAQNVIDYLLAALINSNGHNGVFEIGGPEITTYGDLMIRYAKIRNLNRSLILIPRIPIWFMAFGVGLMTPVPYSIAYALIGGLSADSIVKHPEALKVFPEVKLIDFDSAARLALKKTDPEIIERVWHDGDQHIKSIKHEGCFILHKSMVCCGSTEGGMEVKRGKGMGMRSQHHTYAGTIWYEYRVGIKEKLSYATIMFHPHGLPGFLYWYLLYPMHLWKLSRLIQTIKKYKIAL